MHPSWEDPAARALIEPRRLEIVRAAAQDDPKALLAEMRGWDPTQQEYFSFTMFRHGDRRDLWPYAEPRGDMGWYWQADIVDQLLSPEATKFIYLKARQLGMTWVAVAVGIWHMLYRPGSVVVSYSYDLEQSKKLIQRAWFMFAALPEALRRDFEVVTPERSDLPSEWIKLRHIPTGILSTMQALPATQRAGHGDTVTFGIMDECARMDYAREIYEAINPATSRGGRLAIISTARGVSNNEPPHEGNFFHHLYTRQGGLAKVFLPWDLHPERDEDWYQREAMALPEVERNRQYPKTERDAFMLSGSLYFHTDDLNFYENEHPIVVRKGQFAMSALDHWSFISLSQGMIEVFEPPRNDVPYGISVDVASGSGADYSVAHVIDLTSGQIVAFARARVGIEEFAEQMYWLGRWYNDAIMAPEKAGGWGEAFIIALRNANSGRRPYSNIYRHVDDLRGDRPLANPYGFPMNASTRGEVVEFLKECLRQRLWAWLPQQTVYELWTFVHANTKPTPRAQDGCYDDCVMSLGIAAQLWRRYGVKAHKKTYRRSTTVSNDYHPAYERQAV